MLVAGLGGVEGGLQREKLAIVLEGEDAASRERAAVAQAIDEEFDGLLMFDEVSWRIE